MTDTKSSIIKDNIKMSIPNKPEYVSVVRLTTSALANKIGFNIEEIDDIKVAIAEACTFLLKSKLNNENFNIEYNLFDTKLSIKVRGSRPNTESKECKENILGLFIIESLMDEVGFNKDNDFIEIIMIKEIKDVVK